jgi:hypothetical protein
MTRQDKDTLIPLTRQDKDALILLTAVNILREQSHRFGDRDDDAGVNDLLASCASEAADELVYYLVKLNEYAGMLERAS